MNTIKMVVYFKTLLFSGVHNHYDYTRNNKDVEWNVYYKFHSMAKRRYHHIIYPNLLSSDTAVLLVVFHAVNWYPSQRDTVTWCRYVSGW